MNSIPFRHVEEAKESARLLYRAFAFHQIHLPGAADSIGLQQTQELMARSFGCAGWKDLTRRVELQDSVVYLNEGGSLRSSRDKLAEHLHAIIGAHVPLEAVRAAVGLAAVGCSGRERSHARRFFSVCPAKTAEQWGRLMQVEAVYSYHSRYNRGRTMYEISMLQYSRQAAVAEILGTPKPRKPRRPKAGS